MWKNMDKIAAKMSSGYDVKNLRVEKDKCYMDVVACPLYDKAKALGTPEAVQMICCMDKEYMNGFRGVAYQRTKSVAEGDDCCDYRLNKSV
jgi:predicted ArsR family transcriptional regulator